MNNVLTSKCDNIKSSFKDLYDALDHNIEEYGTESFKVAMQNLSKSYPNEVYDTKSLESKLEVFKIHFSNM